MARWGARQVGLAALALVLPVAACGGGGSSADTTVTLDDDGLTLSVDILDEGAVSFDVDNVGREEHELVVLASPDGGARALPLAPDGSVDLANATPLDRAGPFEPGLYRTGVPNLNAGAYLLICNLPGHFARGLWAAFDVEADNAPAPTPAPDDATSSPAPRTAGGPAARRTTT